MTSDKNITVTNEELVTLILKIENKSDLEGDFQLETSGNQYLRILKNSSAISVGAKEKTFIPIKFLVTKSQPAGKAFISFKLRDQSKNILAESSTTLTIAPKRVLKISTNDPQEIIYQIGDSLRIHTQVHNGGNQSEQVKLVASFPSLSGSPISIEKNIKLEPFSNQNVTFSKIIDRDLLQQELFNVNVAMLNDQNEFIGNAIVLVQNALGNRRYVDPNQQRLLTNVGRGNQVSWSLRNPFNKLDAAQSLDLNTTVNSGDLQAEFNLNSTFYHNQSLPTLFQNTYLKLERQGLGLKVGNLSTTDLDVSLTGRGAEFYLIPKEDRKSTFKIGAVEKSYNLFDPLDLKNSPRGYTAFATSTTALTQNTRIENDFVFDQDPLSNNILFNTRYFYNTEKTQYGIVLGYGKSKSTDESNQQENSMAAGFNLRTQWKAYTLNSDNYFSTGYYPGIRKGSTTFNQRIGRRFKNTSVWAQYNFNRYEPKNINPLYHFSTTTTRHQAEIGTQFRLGSNVSMTIAPQFQSENAGIYLADYLSSTPVEFQSALLNKTIGFQTNNNLHRFNISLVEGIARYKGYTETQFVIKTQFNYYFKNLLFNVSAQKGNFLLYEGTRNQQLTNDTEKYTALLSYRKDFFSKKLNLNFSGMANKDSFVGTSVSLSTNAEFKVGRSTSIFAYYGYTKFIESVYDFNNTYFQVGITQKIPTIGEPGVKYKNGTIAVFVYHDINNDGSFDPETDYPAVGKQVQINKTIFITGKDGKVKYRQVPYGDYTVKSLERDWYAEVIRTSLDSRSVELTIPLEKTGQIYGALQYTNYNKNQYEVSSNLSGIQVLFKNEHGKEFTFYTNENGEYRAYLPLGQYHMTVDAESLQENVFVDQNPIATSAKENEVTTLPTTILKVKERRVEIKRFGE
ncbi:COG1470 family protein [Chryseobacterium sp. A321]